MKRRVRVLTVAGSDSGGGAGVQADLRTLFALGVHGLTAVTAVTAQNSTGVSGVWPVPVTALRAQLDAVLGDIGCDAVKTGMLATGRIVVAVAHRLDGWPAPLVVDPVAVSSTGQQLLDRYGLTALRDRLLPLATVITPNLPEAAALTGRSVTTRAQAERAAGELLGLGPKWVLVTGGHLRGAPADFLTDGTEATWLPGRRLRVRHSHGTGCTLSAALAAGLARGQPVPEAVAAARRFTASALAAGYRLGSGPGPVDQSAASRWRTDPGSAANLAGLQAGGADL